MLHSSVSFRLLSGGLDGSPHLVGVVVSEEALLRLAVERTVPQLKAELCALIRARTLLVIQGFRLRKTWMVLVAVTFSTALNVEEHRLSESLHVKMFKDGQSVSSNQSCSWSIIWSCLFLEGVEAGMRSGERL